MAAPALAFVPLTGDVAEALGAVPAGAGVGQIVAGERSLVLGMAANLRRWAGSHLGLARKPAAGKRPRTNLAGIATAVGWVAADGPFRQRLDYERLIAPLVPLSSRRDLKRPVFLQLDLDARFPRLAVGTESGHAGSFGPFPDRRAAERARAAVHQLFPLRPCEYTFDPDPALPLGTGCLYAQVRSCSAPCLCRVGEADYRGLASSAAAWLADPRLREGGENAVPAVVTAVASSRGVVVDVGRCGLGLYPVQAGRVIEEAAVVASPDGLAAALDRLEWPPVDRPDDWPWLTAWLRGPKGRGSYLLVRGGEDEAELAARARAAGERFDVKLARRRGLA